MRWGVLLSVILGVSMASGGTADVREVEPTAALKTGGTEAWIELTVPWTQTEFSDRRLVVSRLEMDLDRPAGTVLELWISRDPKSLPWEMKGAVPLDRWVMDKRTGTLVRFNIQPGILEAMGNGRTEVTLYLKMDAPDTETPPLSLEGITNLKVRIHHRPRARTRP